MDSEYDRKFEEMKKYIPFLENMIRRLESTSSTSNPRQAQLDKIRSLRDLLMDKKKRMKMENLLKCEQVLVNLYAKVEQRDALPGTKNDDLLKKNTDLNILRNKLKSVVSKLKKEPFETLPEIARASETEEVCEPGSKEPALFQRRPNKSSLSPPHPTSIKPIECPQLSKRNYTRVLLSPEHSQKHWPNEETSSDNPLYIRRSPKKSPRKRSPSYYRKERKKRSKSKTRKNFSKDLNITLNVPEDSLSSLNTKDILSRIINCSDNDVDIATLRELRTQILGELKDTGANDDISDIILKSYKKKDNKSKTTEEVEEGELSDSESEAIESIYGSLVVLDKDKTPGTGSKCLDKEKPRKIQICLVINSDKTKSSCVKNEKDETSGVDAFDFEILNIEANGKEKQLTDPNKRILSSDQNYDNDTLTITQTNDQTNNTVTNICEERSLGSPPKDEQKKEKIFTRNQEIAIITEDDKDNEKLTPTSIYEKKDEESQNIYEKESAKNVSPEPNFYKPTLEQNNLEVETEVEMKMDDERELKQNLSSSKDTNNDYLEDNDTCNLKVDVDIPLLEPTKNVSEIDILQALKKEILSETSNVLSTDTATPLLHQPKITKVANAQEIGSKKRISIESYKAKTVTTSKPVTISDSAIGAIRDDVSRKQSLKLTEKECERFNFLSKITLHDSSDEEEEDKSSVYLDDTYTDLAPKSPDHEDFADTGLKPPVIIPNDPVQIAIVGSEADVDMRKLLPPFKSNDQSPRPVPSPVITETTDILKTDKTRSNNESVSTHFIDPRIKRELNHDISKSYSMNIEKAQIPLTKLDVSPVTHNVTADSNFPSKGNSTPNRNLMPTNSFVNLTPNSSLSVSQAINSNAILTYTPNMTPTRTTNICPNMIPNSLTINVPNMTPSRSSQVNPNMTPSRTPNIAANMNPCMTPSLQAFDNEDYGSNKHVYAPMFSVIDTRDNMEKPDNKQSLWDISESRTPYWEDRNPRNNSMQRDTDYRDLRNSSNQGDIDYREINQSLQRDIGYRDPRNHCGLRDTDYRDPRKNCMQREQMAYEQYQNGPRNDRFGYENRDSNRLEIPTTPIHPFGRLDCPPTPTPSFGFLETPMTPVHSFGRLDCPPTPSHNFGRVEPTLPTQHPFQRSEFNNSHRISRAQDPRLNRNSDYDDDRDRNYYNDRKFNRQDSFRRYNREQSVSRNERNRNYDPIGRNYRDQMSYRETSVGRSFNRDFESDRYSRNRKGGRGYIYRNHNDSSNYEDSERRGYQRERNVRGKSMISQEKSNPMRDRMNFSNDNKLCIKPHAGNSFMIDTSINNTFQDRNTKQKSCSNFDARRQRAASVGRTLINDTSINKTSEKKQRLSNFDDKNSNRFRRACSVGREVRENKLDFEDVKADLKSFKFKSDLKWSKECMKTTDLRSGKDFSDKISCNSNYSPRKNGRDPRMRREYSSGSIDSDCKRHSRNSKNHGIVYSNDNISKGTILGSGYGVKNYKIPKIKRTTEVIEIGDNVITDSVISEENKSNVSDKLASKDDNSNSNNSSKQSNETKVECSESGKKGHKLEICVNETIDSAISKLNLINAKTGNKQELIDDNINRKQEESEEKFTEVSDNNEGKRELRSSRKNMSALPKLLEISPVRRTRKCKKSFITGCDNNDDKTVVDSENSITKEKTSQEVSTVENEEKNKMIQIMADSKDIRITEIIDVTTTQNVCNSNKLSEDTKNTRLTDLELSSPPESIPVKNNSRDNIPTEQTVEKFDTATIKEINKSEINKTEAKDNVKERDLASGFGMDDLEIFSDHVTSDPVIDNINDLIADLDNDLDSTKNSESKTQFTKELNLETMLENIRSPINIDKKDNSNYSPIEKTMRDKNNSEEFHDIQSGVCPEVNNVVAEVDNTSMNNNRDGGESNDEKQDVKLIHNSPELNFGSNSISASKSSRSEIDLSLDSTNIQSGSNTTPYQCKTSGVYIEDTCSNDAIVSTSQDGTIRKPEEMKKQNVNEIVNTPSTPDSTINSNENIENKEIKSSVPDSTNESHCEMSSDITTTDINDTTIKDSIEQCPQTGTSTQIESIGQLLSILQDKSKIKELLSLLGDKTSENEKIKKKLEKLSEVVFEDEVTSEPTTGDTSKENTLDINVPNDEHSNEGISKALEPQAAAFGSKVRDPKEENNIIENVEICATSKKQEVDANTLHHTAEDGALALTKNIHKIEKCIESINKSDEHLNVVKEVGPEFDHDEKLSNICDDVDKVNYASNTKKKVITKSVPRKGKRQRTNNRRASIEERRITRSDSASLQRTTDIDKPVTKKPCRELQKLQEDIREMFLKDDIHSATGIRMCRIAKLVDEKTTSKDEGSNNESMNQDHPVVLLKKCNDLNKSEKVLKLGKKKFKKGKNKNSYPVSLVDIANKTQNISGMDLDTISDLTSTSKLCDKNDSVDPYNFDTDIVPNSANNTKNESSSESDNESLVSTKSCESTEMLADIKKKVKRRRGRGGWKSGIIKTKHKKKKISQKTVISTSNDENPDTQESKYPDFTCFTDKTYCFHKNLSSYNCRLCTYNGTDIVHHYKKEHPHTEVPLSRLSPAEATEAIKESEHVNFRAISKIPSKKYICRFCFKEFGRKKSLLESFFWHVVSMHTGEYKQMCSKCDNTRSCSFDIDIPPPPKETKGQLLGYVCEKCNYTQISLENLKTHVIVWHNDEETAVYTINLAYLSKQTLNLLKREGVSIEAEQPRLLRSSRSNQSVTELSDGQSDTSSVINQDLESVAFKNKTDKVVNEPAIKNTSSNSNIQSKIAFENDNMEDIVNFKYLENSIKNEPVCDDILCNTSKNSHLEPEKPTDVPEVNLNLEKTDNCVPSDDVFDYPHFKIKYTESGSKEYLCCINGRDNHYKTTLLISLKKHVQLKHLEKWDGYCFLCKVIVTPQGVHLFKDCLHHFLDKHMDNFPVLDEVTPETIPENIESTSVDNSLAENLSTNKPYINVRPLSELISKPCDTKSTDANSSVLPVIESVISLGAHIEQPQPSPSYPNPVTVSAEVLKQFKYEEVQAEIMSKKHRVVLEGMMSQIKLVHVFKCAGRFCSFTTDSAEDALLHASTHMRVGGMNALNCAYCDFDSSGNAIDLITHVFKSHGCCQYVCGICFYRAAASQLVNAHIKRVHENLSNVVILRTSFKSSPIQDDNMLSREAAVPYYLCCVDSGSEAPCKFKTYTPGKFCEHVQLRHASATEHSCFMCSTTVSTAVDFIRHLKTHGLKLYQCTWCVFGADNETDLLAHASALHPAKQPKAYLRIITNKEGTSEFRVLPLAHLNKLDIPVTEITPKNVNEFPVREAERSIELEKLIGHTNSMIESMTNSEINDHENELNEIESTLQTERPLLMNSDIPSSTERSQVTSTPPRGVDVELPCDQSTPIIKTEIVETTPEKTSRTPLVVVCLDSDDESSDRNTLNKSSAAAVSTMSFQNRTPRTAKKVPYAELFLCDKCKTIAATASAFRKHITVCFASDAGPVSCAHCPMKVAKKSVLYHYNTYHCNKVEELRHACATCSLRFKTSAQLKEHDAAAHKSEGQSADGHTKEVGPVQRGRRKRCSEVKEKSSEPPEKLKRYGPGDVDRLPINPILDDYVFCGLCEFNTKVRLNMVRHLQLHGQRQPVPQTAPVNPVPHLETNEKHFDKMVNLASSSVKTKAADRSGRPDADPGAARALPAEAASRYPKYVPDKQRLTCGARGCSYISVDETMLKCHWETLHSGSNDFHCVHCPPYQHLDTSKPLTASRIVAHLKMHDDRLYACSLCTYYHFRRQILEKHLSETHKGGRVMIVREGGAAEGGAPGAASGAPAAHPAPTMDLKPWQCGLCKFKSLLRPEVAAHCAAVHNSKMQFKCAYCAFRTSNSENITKHQANCHSGKREEIFYYYYREGSVPDDLDGTPLWQKQSQGGGGAEPKVKREESGEAPAPASAAPATPLSDVDLDIVKKEKIDSTQETIEDLCKEYGEFCEPNGLKYKCSLCKIVIEDNLEAMRSHLYEELKYRKWGCSICKYKAFHNEGLNEHMRTEHRQNREPIALPIDSKIETWVTNFLEHQTALIKNYKENLAKQKVEILRVTSGPSASRTQPQRATEGGGTIPSKTSSKKPDIAELEKIFGKFGAPLNRSYRCPKCDATFKEENLMQNHLESELNKIRWFCSSCCTNFQTYHEAQFHCRSAHGPQGTWPLEVTRDPAVRSAWLETVLRLQRLAIDRTQESPRAHSGREPAADGAEPPDDSLLIVRYEENVPMPEEEVARDETPHSLMDSDDDDRLVIDEPLEIRKNRPSKSCPHCSFVASTERALRTHLFKHYGLKPYMCPFCGFNGSKKSIREHQISHHPMESFACVDAAVPTESLTEYWKKLKADASDSTKLVCLACRNYFTERESLSHAHDGIVTSFGKKGDVVVQCSLCSTFHKDVSRYLTHHKATHAAVGVDYVFSKLTPITMDARGISFTCSFCAQKFGEFRALQMHADQKHDSMLKCSLVPKYRIPTIDLDDDDEEPKRKSDDDSLFPPRKRVARKSTTKLPHFISVAKKSTTKLPLTAPRELEEYSYYGAKPSNDESYVDVVTMMPFCNKVLPFTFKKLKEIIDINPRVRVERTKPPSDSGVIDLC